MIFSNNPGQVAGGIAAGTAITAATSGGYTALSIALALNPVAAGVLGAGVAAAMEINENTGISGLLTANVDDVLLV